MSVHTKSNGLYFDSVQLELYQTSIAQGSVIKEIYASPNSREAYVRIVTQQISEAEKSNNIIEKQCSVQHHSFCRVFEKISMRMFNLMTSNYTRKLNDSLRCKKRQCVVNKNSIQTRKVSKLSSQSV